MPRTPRAMPLPRTTRSAEATMPLPPPHQPGKRRLAALTRQIVAPSPVVAPDARDVAGRLAGKAAVVVGAGQQVGETVGNGMATVLVMARAGAKLLLVDRSSEALELAAAAAREAGAEVATCAADVVDEEDCERIVAACLEAFGRVDIFHYNVGVGEGDSSLTRIRRETWDTLMSINVTGLMQCLKHVVPVMREQRGGSCDPSLSPSHQALGCDDQMTSGRRITSISSVAATSGSPRPSMVTYKVSKAAMNTLMEAVAIENARHAIRANVISPGLMDTPMAIEGNARFAVSRSNGATTLEAERTKARESRSRMVPLVPQGAEESVQGSGWDIAYAALYLNSDEAAFVSGVNLRVDGAAGVRKG